MRSMKDIRQWEIFERNKTRGRQPGLPRLLHMPSVVIASVSFIISLFTFYTSSLQQVDEVSVIFNASGTFTQEKAVDNYGVVASIKGGDLLFVNSGTRVVSIINVGFSVMNAHLADNEIAEGGCPYGVLTTVNPTFTPLIVKAGEIGTAHLKFPSPTGESDVGKIDVSLKLTGDKGLITCGVIGFATPDSGYRIERLAIDRTYPNERIADTVSRQSAMMTSPRELIKRSRTTVRWINAVIDWAISCYQIVQRWVNAISFDSPSTAAALVRH